jgi:hypothetical protein
LQRPLLPVDWARGRGTFGVAAVAGAAACAGLGAWACASSFLSKSVCVRVVCPRYCFGCPDPTSEQMCPGPLGVDECFSIDTHDHCGSCAACAPNQFCEDRRCQCLPCPRGHVLTDPVECKCECPECPEGTTPGTDCECLCLGPKCNGECLQPGFTCCLPGPPCIPGLQCCHLPGTDLTACVPEGRPCPGATP